MIIPTPCSLMNKNLKYVWLGFMILASSLAIETHPVHAELSLRNDRLSVNVQETSLREALNDLSQQGAFRVTVLDTSSFDESTISAQFDRLPITEALDRLLVHWNFGLTKERGTGRIQEIFLASKRMKPEELPEVPQVVPGPLYPEPSPGEDGDQFAHFSPEGGFEAEGEGEEESYDGAPFPAGEDFSEEMIPEDLPSEVREALLEDMAAMRNRE